MKFVATVLTVYGIETTRILCLGCTILTLQQYLPFTVLKQMFHDRIRSNSYSCNSTYRLRY